MAKKYDVGVALEKHLDKIGKSELRKEMLVFIGDVDKNTSEENRIMCSTFLSKKLLTRRATDDKNITNHLMALSNGHTDKEFIAGVKKKVLPLL